MSETGYGNYTEWYISEMKQARDLENREAHPNTNSEDYASLATNGKMSEFRFVTECSYGYLVFLD